MSYYRLPLIELVLKNSFKITLSSETILLSETRWSRMNIRRFLDPLGSKFLSLNHSRILGSESLQKVFTVMVKTLSLFLLNYSSDVSQMG